jgi:DNA (cytosine-5)-methyltransferase 1
MRPRAFVFENVEGFLTGGLGQFVVDLLEPLIDAGYRIHLRKLNAANFGVPQHRKRVVAIGGLFWDPTFPEPTHTAHGAPGAQLAGRTLPRTPSTLDALRGLPEATSPTRPGAVGDHIAYAFEGVDFERAVSLRPGQTMRDLPEQLWHESYRRRAFRRVKDGTPTERRGGAPSGLRRLRGDQPSKAITGGALRDFIHPAENRPLTIRECARLQTFDDGFSFAGGKADRMLLVGNAVPPRLAAVVAKQLLLDFAHSRPCLEQGALLSFVPTLSMGMSPALAAVTRNIERRFGRSQPPAVQLPLWR